MELKCEFEDCGLILQNPVTLMCGSTLCREHLDGFETKFKCFFCPKQHSVPEDGFFVNETIELIVENFYKTDPLRKEIKESFKKLNDIVFDYEKIDPECYIFDYIGDIIRRVDMHRDVMIDDITVVSNTIINQLNDKLNVYKSNLANLVKNNLDHLKQDDFFTNKVQQLITSRILRSEIKEFNDLVPKLKEKIRQVQIETKSYKNKLLMNEYIYFNQHEQSNSFGTISFYSNKNHVFMENFGQLIKSFMGDYDLMHSIQVDEKSNKLIMHFPNKINITDLETGEILKTLYHEAESILITQNNKLISADLYFFDKIRIWDLGSYKCLNQLETNSTAKSLCLISNDRIACGCQDGSILILNLNNINEIASFKAHDNSISHLLYIQKSTLISYSDDKKIRVWNIETFQIIKEIDTNSLLIDYLEAISDEVLLSFSSKLNTANLWQLETGKMIESIKFEFDVSCVKLLNDELIALGLQNGEIKIHNFIKSETIKTISADNSSIRSILLLSNGNLISCSKSYIKHLQIFDQNLDEFKHGSKQSDSLINEIKNYSDKLNRLIDDYEKINPEFYVINYIEKIINQVNLHLLKLTDELNEISDKIIDMLKEKKKICISNAEKLEKVNLNQLLFVPKSINGDSKPIQNQLDDFESLAKSFRTADLKKNEQINILSNMNEKIRLVKNETKNFTNNLLINEAIYFEKYEKSVSFGKLSFYSNKTNVLSLDCGKLIKSFHQHTDCITSIQVDEKSNKLISGSKDKTIKIWNLETGQCLKTLEDHNDCVRSILLIQNNKFVSGSADKIKVWDLNSYKCLSTFLRGTIIETLCMISNNEIACGNVNGSIDVMDVQSEIQSNSIKFDKSSIICLVPVNNSKLICCSTDRQIKIINLKTRECINIGPTHNDKVNYLELTLDGNLLSCSSDATVILWQIETGKMLNLFKFEHPVYCVKSLTNELIAVALDNGQIQIYNLNKKETITTFSAHKSRVNYLHLLKNGDLLSGSSDGEIKLWKMIDVY